ncbi:efflux RND transporter permease subunit, partial [Brachyspira hyodysenteriae]|uniref:efflux RND transporter permease subunit n=1 Tax=Brachyspira hyodysenteriae TaxID=159 RepID=UPI0015C445AF
VTSMKGGGNSDSSGIDIDIVGEDLVRARELANNVIAALQDVPGLRDVRLKKSDASPLFLLLITGQTLSVYSGIGVIVLIGIVVNNGIV